MTKKQKSEIAQVYAEEIKLLFRMNAKKALSSKAIQLFIEDAIEAALNPTESTGNEP